MNLPQPPPEGSPSSSTIPKSALVAMLLIIVVMALLSLYANVQRWRRDKLEQVTITPAALPTASPVTP